MSTLRDEIEEQIEAKGLNAPRVTLATIEESIVAQYIVSTRARDDSAKRKHQARGSWREKSRKRARCRAKRRAG